MDIDSDRFGKQFLLDPHIDYLNHGSFGACPAPVLLAQQALRERIERGPTRFLAREYEGLIDGARRALAELVDAEPEHLAFVPNATTGVNIALNALALSLRAGDELIATTHTYNACKNALLHVAERAGASVVWIDLPFPLAREDAVLESILARVTPRTRVLLIDHVTSPTGLVLPVAAIVKAMHARSIQVIVDGAHAPGLLPLSIRAIGADYYTGNCHKWLCTPKGSAFLHVADTTPRTEPLVISHGARVARTDRPKLWLEHDWVGTVDPTPFLCIPSAIDFLSSLLPGGLAGLQQRNRELALAARAILCGALAIEPPAPDSMIAALVALPLPPRAQPEGAWQDALQPTLYDAHKIEAVVSIFPAAPARVLRVCAQAYNYRAQYERLASALRKELAAETS